MGKRVFRRLIFGVILIFLGVSLIFIKDALAQDAEVYVAKGIEKMNEGDYKGAIEFFREALKLSPDDPEAMFYTAVTYFHLSEYEKAERLFQRVLQIDRNVTDVYFELGRLYYVTSRCDEAEESLKRFISLSEDEDLKGYAERLIKDCREGAVGAKKFRLYFTLGGQYDSNVILEPSNPGIEIGKEEDARIVALLTAVLQVLQKEDLRLGIRYNFYQSLHYHLSNYNIHYHKVNSSVEIPVSEMFVPVGEYTFEYTMIGGDRYSVFHSVTGKLRLLLKEGFPTEMIYTYRDNNYYNTELFENNKIRSGFRNSFGVRQDFTIGRVNGEVYCFGDYEHAEAEFWSHRGYRAGIEGSFKIVKPLAVKVSGEYNERRYRGEYPGYNKKRIDRMTELSLRLMYMLREGVEISLTETYVVNDSNLELFDYERNIVGIVLTMEVL